MSVTAKLTCTKIEDHETQGPDEVCKTVHFAALYGDGTGNESWSKWTPQGEAKLMITNPDALVQFEEGAEYLVEFKKA